MEIFVSGATGVIGRRAVPMMAAAGHKVTAVVRAPEKAAMMKRMGASPVQVDLFDPAAVRKAAAGQEVIVNLATRIPPSARAFLPFAWRENDRIRRFVSANLVEAGLEGGAARFIQESFAPISPDRGEAWIDESTPVAPALYNRSVVDAERAAARFTEQGGSGVTLRFALFYGPDSGYTVDAIQFVRKGWAPSFGRPEGFLSSVSHDDAASAVMAALGAPPGIYNVVDDEPLPRRDHYRQLAGALGVPAPKIPPLWSSHLAGSLGETLARSQRISNRKLRSAWGWGAA